MRRHRLFLFGLVLSSAITLLLSGIPELVAGERITLKYGHSLGTDHPFHEMALKFKEELEKRNKNVVINIFPLMQLGNERDLTEGAQLGSIDIATATSAIVAGFVPGLKAFSLPFLFRDEDQMFRVMDSDIGKAIDKGKIVEGYAFVHDKKGNAKPTCNNNGACEPELGEKKNCADCKANGEEPPEPGVKLWRNIELGLLALGDSRGRISKATGL